MATIAPSIGAFSKPLPTPSAAAGGASARSLDGDDAIAADPAARESPSTSATMSRRTPSISTRKLAHRLRDRMVDFVRGLLTDGHRERAAARSRRFPG
jgi:hypothetical protein